MQQEMEQGTPDSFRLTPYTRMTARLQLDRVQSEIERFKGMLQMLGENGEDLQNVMRYLDERMRDLTACCARSSSRNNARRASSREISPSAAHWRTKVSLFTPKTISGA